MRRLAGSTAIALGIVYLVFGVVFFLLPEGQQVAGAASLLDSLVADGTAGFLFSQWLLVLSGVLGLAVVGGFARVFERTREGVVRWASAFGYLGFGVTIVDAFSTIAFVYSDGHRVFAEADEQMRPVIAGDFAVSSIAPQGWATFGLVGVWLLVISILAVVDRTALRGPAVFGVAGAIGYWLVPLGSATQVEALIMVAAALAIVVGPVFYVWAGVLLRRDPSVETARNSG